MVFYLIGIGLSGEDDITVKGLEIVKRCSKVYLEHYTAILMVDAERLVSIIECTTYLLCYICIHPTHLSICIIVCMKKKISVLKQQINMDEATVSIKTDDGYFRVKVADILFIESVSDHVCIHLPQSQLITRNTLKFYVAALSEHGFHQVHKSSLVNLKHVINIKKLRFSDYQLTLSNQTNLKVSRRYKSILDKIIN